MLGRRPSSQWPNSKPAANVMSCGPRLTTSALRCAPTLRQVGFRNRVWIVKRTYTSSAEDERPKVSLGPYDLPWWPEALLVVRT